MTATRSRAEQKQYTRALITDAAKRAIGARGLYSLAVRELAREADIVPTAFYRHFESVEDLAAHLIAHSAAALGELVDDLVAQPAPSWPGAAAAAAAADRDTWAVLLRGWAEPGHPGHAVVDAAVDTARRRIGIALGRHEPLVEAPGAVIDIAADLVVVDLIRLLGEVAAGEDPATGAAVADGRLAVILAGAGAVT